MHRTLFFASLVLFLASVIPSNAQSASKQLNVVEGDPLIVECELRVEQQVAWRRDGKALPADMKPAGETLPAGERLKARLKVGAARPEHAGAYTCAPDQRLESAIYVAVRPKRPSATAGEVPLVETESTLPVVSAGTYPPLFYDVGRNLSLKCEVSGATGPYVWSKNGTNIDAVPEVKARFDVDETGAVLTAKGRAQEEDYGNFTCERGGLKQGWDVRGKPHVKLPQNTNVVEEQKVKIQCKVIGKPYPSLITWTYRNGSSNGNSTGFEVMSGDRFTLQAGEQNVQGAELIIEKAQRSDAGEYTCQVTTDEHHAVNATTTLRVKDMYAALWPFLGICAEVFILCAIILVYEKRRTKPEMDDSDTDNHDQKKS